MLELHRAERASTLATGLATLLAEPLADAFAADVVAVPAKGVERWLRQRLSLSLGAAGVSDGIAANIDFPSPGRLVDDVLAVVTGVDADSDPWAAGPLLWTVLRVIDECSTEPWCSVLSRSIGGAAAAPDDHRRGRRWSTASHVSGLFRSYAAQRPSMIVDWAAGADTDGAGAPLAPDLLWQAELWRRVRERIGVPGPAERLDPVCDALAEDGSTLDLPSRLSLFGATRLTTLQRRVLRAVAYHRDVHLWLPHPSPVSWAATSRRAGAGSVRRVDAPPVSTAGHPLLVSLGRDVRELQPLLEPTADADRHLPDPERSDARRVEASTTVLRRMQNDIVADRAPAAPDVPGMDDSVQIHACHGPARQVDVLRDTLLHLFQDDPTLEPRDVLIMCPDVDTFAPLVRAAFGNEGAVGDPSAHPAHGLRVRLADRGLRRTNPVLDVIAAMIEMAGDRVTASQMLDLAASEAVRTRFRFSDDDLERLAEWTRVSGARWGIDSVQRELFGLGDFRQNTFTAAMDRLLLGAAADETTGDWLGLALPVDDVDGNDIDLAGRYAELVDRVSVVLRGMRGEHPVRTWRASLIRAIDLLTEVGPADVRHRVDALRELSAALEHGDDISLQLADIRSMLRDRLAGRPTRSNFRTGELTVCTMVPMRSVPHRVVVLLGLDDDVFPRAGHLDGDDVLARGALIGERDIRSEDRQLLLDALMSAGEKLVLFHTGANPVSGAHEPPAIPLSEVIEVVAATAGVENNRAVTRHPLQPFDPSIFDGSAPAGFDSAALAGAVAASAPFVPRQPFLDGPLPARDSADVALAELVAFVQSPVTAFVRQRLKVGLSGRDDDVVDALAVELDALSAWDIGERMLSALLTGVELADFRAAEWRRGTLPPFAQGARLLEQIETDVVPIADAAAEMHVGPPESVDVVVDLDGGRRLTGTVPGVHGTTVARTSYSRMAPKRRLEAWIHLLAVAAQSGSDGWTAVTTARGRSSRPVSRSTLTTPEDARAVLAELADLRDRGLREPLPLALKSGEAYAARVVRGSSEEMALAAAAQQFSDRFGDVTEPAVLLVHGSGVDFGQWTAIPPAADEAKWSADGTRFGVLARRVWQPLLTHESMEQR
ncbi:exodeoxyribonuclease V subunit gamma [Rhodococcus sp. BP-332]|uniref:exodeoxyribonuclease V subunit gamma n=1 Tax=Rhodococcus sp. BP-332 TaxID=2739447 RepID=UPI001C9AF705|nr:exodeoxyribonuclease V subunit gamma [Rhodococcus sp. BP-332]MBY6679412.1 exodeoxyribonuclease V subunit gamma [Rhodococcus sp. BP-332]